MRGVATLQRGSRRGGAQREPLTGNPRFPLKGSFKGDIDVDIDTDVEVDLVPGACLLKGRGDNPCLV